MTEQSKNNQTTGENQISETAKSSDYERTLDEEGLSGVSEAGIGNAIHVSIRKQSICRIRENFL
jgi:hypothetical protein